MLLQAAAAAYAADRAALEQQLAKLASEARKQEKAAAAKLAAAQRDREKEKEGHAVELEQLVAEKEVNTIRKRFTHWRLTQWRFTRIWRSRTSSFPPASALQATANWMRQGGV